MSIEERLARVEEQVKAMALDVIELQSAGRIVESRVDALEQAEHRRDERERTIATRAAQTIGRRFALAGLALTGLNIAAAVTIPLLVR